MAEFEINNNTQICVLSSLIENGFLAEPILNVITGLYKLAKIEWNNKKWWKQLTAADC